MSLDCLVVIPACGEHEMTRGVVRLVLSEDCDCTVVDNAGDYPAIGRERVLRPATNIGWLGAANLGLAWGFRRGYGRVCVLNNDVVLSREFVAGLVAAAAEGGPTVGMVGPLSNEQIDNGQYFDHDPDLFVPYPETLEAPFVHGSCLLYTRAGYAAAGPMDAAQQPYGWGTDIEAGMLCRERGLKVLVSKYSYMRHLGSATVKAMGEDPAAHERSAQEHLRGVFRRKYGPAWQTRLGFRFGCEP